MFLKYHVTYLEGGGLRRKMLLSCRITLLGIFEIRMMLSCRITHIGIFEIRMLLLCHVTHPGVFDGDYELDIVYVVTSCNTHLGVFHGHMLLPCRITRLRIFEGDTLLSCHKACVVGRSPACTRSTCRPIVTPTKQHHSLREITCDS